MSVSREMLNCRAQSNQFDIFFIWEYFSAILNISVSFSDKVRSDYMYDVKQRLPTCKVIHMNITIVLNENRAYVNISVFNLFPFFPTLNYFIGW